MWAHVCVCVYLYLLGGACLVAYKRIIGGIDARNRKPEARFA